MYKRQYQNGVHGIGAMRGVPDVAADANTHTGFPVVTSNASRGYTISGHGGTSASAPTWAGIIALADQYANRHLGFVNPAIYQIASSSSYHQAFHDITVGNLSLIHICPGRPAELIRQGLSGADPRFGRAVESNQPRDDHRLPSRSRVGSCLLYTSRCV